MAEAVLGSGRSGEPPVLKRIEVMVSRQPAVGGPRVSGTVSGRS